MRALLLPVLVLAMAGCGEPFRAGFSARDASAPRDVATPTDLPLSVDVAPIPLRDAGIDNCTTAARLVYVLSDANDLYSFAPLERRFTLIGRLRCPTTMQPNSMAIDRNAVAWVNYVESGLGDSAGAIYRVNTRDASCTDDPPIRLPPGWFRLGMGFSTGGVDNVDETLFVAATSDPFGGPSRGLAQWDAAVNRLVPLGSFNEGLGGQSAELTGTGDGRLFGFFTTTPVRVAQIDRLNARILENRPLPQVEMPAAWAFSFWGGDFYLYTAPSVLLGRGSAVTRYRPSDGSVDSAWVRDVGFRIVGAGVSTCAPVAPP